MTNIGFEEIGSRAGEHSLGYVEPSQAAWDLLEDSIEDIRAGMKRRFEAGMKPATEKICQGILLGLLKDDGEKTTARSDGRPTSQPKPRPGACRFSSSCIRNAKGERPATESSRP